MTEYIEVAGCRVPKRVHGEELDLVVWDVIEDNPKAAKDRANGYIVGQVARVCPGADLSEARGIVDRILGR